MSTIKRRVFREVCENVARETIYYEDGELLQTQWYAPAAGGYVRDSYGRQVCYKLDVLGPTLCWEPSMGLTLAQLLRREWRRARDADRRAERRRP